MSCRAWEELLQELLDGTGAGRLEQHLNSCPSCAAEQPALRRFLEGVALLSTTTPPAGLDERIAGCLMGDYRQQRRLRLRRRIASAGMLAAAALLVAVGMHFWQPATVTQVSVAPDSSVAKTTEPPAALFRDSVAQASNAVASLTSRTASETMDQTASLLPLLPAPTLEPISAGPAPIEPLREASAGVSSGLEPVADSARRAVGLFLRDLPMGRTESPTETNKPG
jgi:hypothetical protein